jgi:hypothetical protein
MSTITKKDLVDRITESTQTKRVLVKATVQNFFDEVISELTKGNHFQGSVLEGIFLMRLRRFSPISLAIRMSRSRGHNGGEYEGLLWYSCYQDSTISCM